jgi:hypothetical protein
MEAVRERWVALTGRGKVGVGCGTLAVVVALCYGAASQLPNTQEYYTEQTATTEAKATGDALDAVPSDTPEPTAGPPTDTAEPDPTDTEPVPTGPATDTPDPPTEAPSVEPPTLKPLPPTEALPPSATPPPPNPEGAAPADEYNCPPDYPVKGNIGSNGNIYHMPAWRSYSRTKPERCFATAADAEAAGFRAPKNP